MGSAGEQGRHPVGSPRPLLPPGAARPDQAVAPETNPPQGTMHSLGLLRWSSCCDFKCHRHGEGHCTLVATGTKRGMNTAVDKWLLSAWWLPHWVQLGRKLSARPPPEAIQPHT